MRIPTTKLYPYQRILSAVNDRLGLAEFYVFSDNFFGIKTSEETPSEFNNSIRPSAPSEMVIESSPINRAKEFNDDKIQNNLFSTHSDARLNSTSLIPV